MVSSSPGPFRRRGPGCQSYWSPVAQICCVGRASTHWVSVVCSRSRSMGRNCSRPSPWWWRVLVRARPDR